MDFKPDWNGDTPSAQRFRRKCAVLLRIEALRAEYVIRLGLSDRERLGEIIAGRELREARRFDESQVLECLEWLLERGGERLPMRYLAKNIAAVFKTIQTAQADAEFQRNAELTYF